MPIPMADATASAALVLAGVALTVALATISLVITRTGAQSAPTAANPELALLRRQLGAQYRPLLVDVLANAPAPPDMGATESIELPGTGPRSFDPRTVFVAIEAGKVYLSVPLRNVGRGLAVIDRTGVVIAGAGLGELDHRTVQREHVPVNETTRIELITDYRLQELDRIQGTEWQLTVPYSDFGGEQRTVASLQIVCRGDEVGGPWSVERVEQRSVADRAPSSAGAEMADVERQYPEPADSAAAASPQDRPSREQLTDIWGNPLVKRRGKRR